MRKNAQTRSDRSGRQEFLSWAAPLVVLGVLFVGFVLLRTTVREERSVAGTVQSAEWRTNGDTGQRYPDIEVVLANHRVVRVGSIAPALPEIGSEIVLMKRRMLLGYTTYRWEGDLRPPPQPTSGPTPVSLH